MSINNNIPYSFKIHDQLYSKLNNDDMNDDNDNNNDNDHRKSSICQFFKKPAPILILVPFFLYFLSVFLNGALSTQLVITMVCMKMKNLDIDDVDNDSCNDAKISKEASRIYFYISLCTTIPSFLMSGPYGSLADRYGRKIILLISTCGWCMQALASAYIAYTKPDNYLIILIIASILWGFSGGFQSFQLGSYSYITDITNHMLKFRTIYYTILESFMLIAKIIGPISAGWYASKEGYFQPLGLAAVVSICTVVWINMMPESLSIENQQPFKIEMLKSFHNIKLFFSLKSLQGRSPLSIIAISFFLYFTSYLGYLYLYVLYLKHMFGSKVRSIGYFASLESVISVASMLLIPYLIKLVFGNVMKSIYWIQIGYIAQSIFFFSFASVTSEYQIYLCLIILLLTGPIVPMTRVILTNSVAMHLQTTILAAFSAVQSTSQLLCPLILIIYSDNVEEKPAIMFFIFSGMNCVGAILISLLLLNQTFHENLPDADGLVKQRITDEDTGDLTNMNNFEKLNAILFGDTNIINNDRNASIESIDNNNFYVSLLPASSDRSNEQVEL